MFFRCKSGNTIAYAAAGDAVNIALDELLNKSLALEARTGLALLPMLSKLSDDQIDQDGVLRI
jgi:hypothetical protein